MDDVQVLIKKADSVISGVKDSLGYLAGNNRSVTDGQPISHVLSNFYRDQGQKLEELASKLHSGAIDPALALDQAQAIGDVSHHLSGMANHHINEFNDSAVQAQRMVHDPTFYAENPHLGTPAMAEANQVQAREQLDRYAREIEDQLNRKLEHLATVSDERLVKDPALFSGSPEAAERQVREATAYSGSSSHVSPTATNAAEDLDHARRVGGNTGRLADRAFRDTASSPELRPKDVGEHGLVGDKTLADRALRDPGNYSHMSAGRGTSATHAAEDLAYERAKGGNVGLSAERQLKPAAIYDSLSSGAGPTATHAAEDLAHEQRLGGNVTLANEQSLGDKVRLMAERLSRDPKAYTDMGLGSVTQPSLIEDGKYLSSTSDGEVVLRKKGVGGPQIQYMSKEEFLKRGGKFPSGDAFEDTVPRSKLGPVPHGGSDGFIYTGRTADGKVIMTRRTGSLPENKVISVAEYEKNFGALPERVRFAGVEGGIISPSITPRPIAEVATQTGESVSTLDSFGARNGLGWKLHLNVGRILNEPGWEDRAKPVVKLLNQLEKEGKIDTWKFANDGQYGAGKDFTVYIGKRDEAESVAELIDKKVGGSLLPQTGRVLEHDQPFGGSAKVYGRFDVGAVDGNGHPDFKYYGKGGVSLTADAPAHFNALTAAEQKAWLDHSHEQLAKVFGKDYTGTDGKLLSPTQIPEPSGTGGFGVNDKVNAIRKGGIIDDGWKIVKADDDGTYLLGKTENGETLTKRMSLRGLEIAQQYPVGARVDVNTGELLNARGASRIARPEGLGGGLAPEQHFMPDARGLHTTMGTTPARADTVEASLPREAGEFTKARFPVGSEVHYNEGGRVVRGRVVGYTQDAHGVDKVKISSGSRFDIPESIKTRRLLALSENAPIYEPGDVVRFQGGGGRLNPDEWKVEKVADGKVTISTVKDGKVYTNELDINEASQRVAKSVDFSALETGTKPRFGDLISKLSRHAKEITARNSYRMAPTSDVPPVGRDDFRSTLDSEGSLGREHNAFRTRIDPETGGTIVEPRDLPRSAVEGARADSATAKLSRHASRITGRTSARLAEGIDAGTGRLSRTAASARDTAQKVSRGLGRVLSDERGGGLSVGRVSGPNSRGAVQKAGRGLGRILADERGGGLSVDRLPGLDSLRGKTSSLINRGPKTPASEAEAVLGREANPGAPGDLQLAKGSYTPKTFEGEDFKKGLSRGVDLSGQTEPVRKPGKIEIGRAYTPKTFEPETGLKAASEVDYVPKTSSSAVILESNDKSSGRGRVSKLVSRGTNTGPSKAKIISASEAHPGEPGDIHNAKGPYRPKSYEEAKKPLSRGLDLSSQPEPVRKPGHIEIGKSYKQKNFEPEKGGGSSDIPKTSSRARLLDGHAVEPRVSRGGVVLPKGVNAAEDVGRAARAGKLSGSLSTVGRGGAKLAAGAGSRAAAALGARALAVPGAEALTAGMGVGARAVMGPAGLVIVPAAISSGKSLYKAGSEISGGHWGAAGHELRINPYIGAGGFMTPGGMANIGHGVDSLQHGHYGEAARDFARASGVYAAKDVGVTTYEGAKSLGELADKGTNLSKSVSSAAHGHGIRAVDQISHSTLANVGGAYNPVGTGLKVGAAGVHAVKDAGTALAHGHPVAAAQAAFHDTAGAAYGAGKKQLRNFAEGTAKISAAPVNVAQDAAKGVYHAGDALIHGHPLAAGKAVFHGTAGAAWGGTKDVVGGVGSILGFGGGSKPERTTYIGKHKLTFGPDGNTAANRKALLKGNGPGWKVEKSADGKTVKYVRNLYNRKGHVTGAQIIDNDSAVKNGQLVIGQTGKGSVYRSAKKQKQEAAVSAAVDRVLPSFETIGTSKFRSNPFGLKPKPKKPAKPKVGGVSYLNDPFTARQSAKPSHKPKKTPHKAVSFRGPVGPLGPVGPTPQVHYQPSKAPAVQQHRAQHPAAKGPIGPLGPVGPHGPAGPLGPVGPHSPPAKNTTGPRHPSSKPAPTLTLGDAFAELGKSVERMAKQAAKKQQKATKSKQPATTYVPQYVYIPPPPPPPPVQVEASFHRPTKWQSHTMGQIASRQFGKDVIIHGQTYYGVTVNEFKDGAITYVDGNGKIIAYGGHVSGSTSQHHKNDNGVSVKINHGDSGAGAGHGSNQDGNGSHREGTKKTHLGIEFKRKAGTGGAPPPYQGNSPVKNAFSFTDKKGRQVTITELENGARLEQVAGSHAYLINRSEIAAANEAATAAGDVTGVAGPIGGNAGGGGNAGNTGGNTGGQGNHEGGNGGQNGPVGGNAGGSTGGDTAGGTSTGGTGTSGTSQGNNGNQGGGNHQDNRPTGGGENNSGGDTVSGNRVVGGINYPPAFKDGTIVKQGIIQSGKNAGLPFTITEMPDGSRREQVLGGNAYQTRPPTVTTAQEQAALQPFRQTETTPALAGAQSATLLDQPRGGLPAAQPTIMPDYTNGNQGRP